MSSLEDLEARVAALEASQADYRAVLTAVNALGANQREHSERMGRMQHRMDSLDSAMASVERTLDDTNARVRSLEGNTAEIKDLLIRALDR